MGTLARLSALPHVAPERETVDYRLDDFVLDAAGRKLKPLELDEAITGSGMNLSVEEASTFTIDVLDIHRKLLRSDFLTDWGWGKNADDRDEAHWIKRGRPVAATVDDIDLRLVKVSKNEDTLTLTFEEEAVVKLRNIRGARKATRFDIGSGVTRAEFVASLCREAGVEYHIPEQHVKPDVVAPEEAPGIVTKDQRRKEGKKGLDASAGITVKGQEATHQQLDILQRGLDVGDHLNAPRMAMLALIVAATAESTVSYAVNSIGYGGPWQGDVSHRYHYFKATDVEGMARCFFKGGKGFQAGGAIHLARAHPGWSAGDIANAVEAGGAGAHFYGQWGHEARKTLAAYAPGFSSSGTSVKVTTQKPFQFERGEHESSWDAMVRLAEEVGWRVFVRKGVLWYVSDEYLFNQAPQLVFREKQHGVDNIDFDVDQNARNGVAEIAVTARSNRWTALPGMVAVARGVGLADGRWIVATAERESLNIANDNATITCHKPMPTKPEPAPETESESFSLREQVGKGGRVKITGGSDALQVAYAVLQASKRISAQHKPYLWGGGHGPIRSFSPGSRFDCSGSVSYALFMAGVFSFSTGITSGAFSGWGKAGPGKYMTVWYHGGHVFIEFTIPGVKISRFDTSQHAHSGPRTVVAGRSHAGFRARHWHKGAPGV